MPKLKNFDEAKRKFKTDEDAEYYFVLVELYEKHLKSEQKEAFFKADTIDGMLDVLDGKQLGHLIKLINAFMIQIVGGGSGTGYPHPEYIEFVNEAYSEWFKSNMFDRIFKDSSKQPELPDVDGLINRIAERKGARFERDKAKKGTLINEYKSRLKKFDGNSVEYRQWLILLFEDDMGYFSIPNINKIYNVNKLLKQLNVERLRSLKDLLERESVSWIVSSMDVYEPYYYFFGNSEQKSKSAGTFLKIEIEDDYKPDESVTALFDSSLGGLISKIDDIIKEKDEWLEMKIEHLVKSKTFEEDVLEIAHNLGTSYVESLKEAISKYCKTGVNGSYYNHFLRKAFIVNELQKEIDSDVESSAQKLEFMSDLAKVYEYFERHLLSHEYTVYRGMGVDGLYALLGTARPKIDYDKEQGITDSVIESINKLKPIVFDKGITSTSLNKGVSAVRFRGTSKGNVFFTIKIPSGSKALVLDYEEMDTVPAEEEVLLAPKTKMKIQFIKEVKGHYEIDAEVVK